MRLVVLLGSGASIGAGMPSVWEITERVLSGENVFRHSDEHFYLVDELADHHDTEPVEASVSFLDELKAISDSYFAVHEPGRETNYEDLAYFARQIDDAVGFEYENPALAPLIERLVGGAYSGRNPYQLKEAASQAADYIEDVVCALLSRPRNDLGYLAPLSDAVADEQVEQLDLFTLNHDLVFETHLRECGLPFSDGFDREHGTLRLWTDTYVIPTRRFFKLHGSVNWYRYNLTVDGWSGQFDTRAEGDPDHARDPDGAMHYPAGRLLLTGTFNKILSYPTAIFADQHARFHEALGSTDRLLVVGCGFRDKAINARLIAWAERPGKRRMVVAHRDPDRLGEGARGAIQQKWDRWQKNGLLAFVPRHLEHTTWGELGDALGVT
jgi:hypothetical protein